MRFTAAVVFVAWCVVIGWVATDSARRGRSGFGWALLVATTNVLGLALWLFLRRRLGVVGGKLSPLKTVLLWFAGVPALIVSALLVLQIGSALVLIQVARIEGAGMAPTLNNQDRLIVDRLAYRLHAPARGDMVMHRYPRDPEKSFVKRVVARGGDTVRSIDGRVYVNDIAVSDDYVPRAYRSHDTWGPHTIQDGEYFVLGDHRNNSSDSRQWGTVPADLIVGRIAVRWWPIPDATIF
jgi:signal peptidase I